MRKVALITTWGERCGLAEYAMNLTKNCKATEFKIVPRPFDLNEVNGSEILHLNYEAGLFAPVFSSDAFLWKQREGYKTILTLHTSHAGNNMQSGKILGFDRVVVHERTQDNCTFIPMGIPDERPRTKVSEETTVGTFGFPFNWKGFTEVVLACKQLGIRALAIAPESNHADTYQMKRHLESLYDNIEYYTQYFSQQEVIDLLGTCAATVFAYHGGNYGISAACRLGLATGMPIVLTKGCRQFRDLLEYEDEIYFADSPAPQSLVTQLQEALATKPKKPNRVLKEMGWQKTGRMYQEIYDSL